MASFIFTLRHDINNRVFACHKPDRSSCTLAFPTSSSCRRLDKPKCSSKTITGPMIINANHIHLQSKKMNDYLLNATSNVIKTHNARAAIKSWSGEGYNQISKALNNYFWSRILKVPNAYDTHMTKIADTILRLQRTCTTYKTSKEITVYKGMRSVRLLHGSTTDLEPGHEYVLPFFSSTTINKSIDITKFMQFLAGTCVMEITLPIGTWCYYLGNDPDRTNVPGEYELLLPVGGRLEVHEKKTKMYASDDRNFMRVTVYKCSYKNPDTTKVNSYLNNSLSGTLDPLTLGVNNPKRTFKPSDATSMASRFDEPII